MAAIGSVTKVLFPLMLFTESPALESFSVAASVLLQMIGQWVRWGVVDLYQGVGEGTRGGYYLVVSAFVFFLFVCFCWFFFFLHLCFCPLFSHVLCPFLK